MCIYVWVSSNLGFLVLLRFQFTCESHNNLLEWLHSPAGWTSITRWWGWFYDHEMLLPVRKYRTWVLTLYFIRDIVFDSVNFYYINILYHEFYVVIYQKVVIVKEIIGWKSPSLPCQDLSFPLSHSNSLFRLFILLQFISGIIEMGKMHLNH